MEQGLIYPVRCSFVETSKEREMKVCAVLCGVLLLASGAHSQDGVDSTIFVPRQGVDQVPIEIVFPLKEHKDAYAKAVALRRLIERRLRPQRNGDGRSYLGKCMVEPYQLELGLATLRIECWSLGLWPGDEALAAIGAPETAEEAMVFIDAFLAKHRERLARPVPPPAPTRSQMVRMA